MFTKDSTSSSLFWLLCNGDSYVQWTMLHRYRRHRWHCYVEQYWFNVVLTLSINVVQYRIIVSTSITANNLAYIVHNVDMAKLYDIKSTSCQYRLSLISLLSSFISLTSQCCMISNQHRFHIAMLYDIKSTFCHHRLPLISLSTSLHRRHRNSFRNPVIIVSTSTTSNILVHKVHNVDIAILYNIISTCVDIAEY